MNNVGLRLYILGTSIFMVTLIFFLGVNRSDPNQSQILQGLGTTSWSMCKQPLRVSFHVGRLPTSLQWKYRFHLVKFISSIEFGGQSAYMKTNLYSFAPQLKDMKYTITKRWSTSVCSHFSHYFRFGCFHIWEGSKYDSEMRTKKSYLWPPTNFGYEL